MIILVQRCNTYRIFCVIGFFYGQRFEHVLINLFCETNQILVAAALGSTKKVIINNIFRPIKNGDV